MKLLQLVLLAVLFARINVAENVTMGVGSGETSSQSSVLIGESNFGDLRDSIAIGYGSGDGYGDHIRSTIIGTWAGAYSLSSPSTITHSVSNSILLGYGAGYNLNDMCIDFYMNEQLYHDYVPYVYTNKLSSLIGLGPRVLMNAGFMENVIAIGANTLKGAVGLRDIIAIGNNIGIGYTNNAFPNPAYENRSVDSPLLGGRMWLDPIGGGDPDKSAITYQAPEIGLHEKKVLYLGKEDGDIVLRGMIRDKANPEIYYDWSNGVCTVYNVTYPASNRVITTLGSLVMDINAVSFSNAVASVRFTDRLDPELSYDWAGGTCTVQRIHDNYDWNLVCSSNVTAYALDDPNHTQFLVLPVGVYQGAGSSPSNSSFSWGVGFPSSTDSNRFTRFNKLPADPQINSFTLVNSTNYFKDLTGLSTSDIEGWGSNYYYISGALNLYYRFQNATTTIVNRIIFESEIDSKIANSKPTKFYDQSDSNSWFQIDGGTNLIWYAPVPNGVTYSLTFSEGAYVSNTISSELAYMPTNTIYFSDSIPSSGEGVYFDLGDLSFRFTDEGDVYWLEVLYTNLNQSVGGYYISTTNTFPSALLPLVDAGFTSGDSYGTGTLSIVSYTYESRPVTNYSLIITPSSITTAGGALAENVVTGAVCTVSSGNKYFWTTATNVTLSASLTGGQVVNYAELTNTATNSITAVCESATWRFTGGSLTNTIPASTMMIFGWSCNPFTGKTNFSATAAY